MRRFGVVLYVLAAISLLATSAGLVLGPEWIEEVTGLEPDGGSGALEFLLVLAPAVAALILGGSAYAVRRAASPP
jgi:hypothetical protein